MRMRIRLAIILAVMVVAVVGKTAIAQGDVHAQSLPPLPFIYGGGAFLSDGSSVPDGHFIVARIEDYESEPADVRDGGYKSLTVGPPDITYHNKQVTFHLDGVVQAAQTDTFNANQGPLLKANFHLTFPNIPTPTPTPTATPTQMATPTATPPAALPSVYSGEIIIAGGLVPEGATLVAGVGSYETLPAAIQGQNFLNLVVDPGDSTFFGQPVEFYLNGSKARTTDIYESGARKRDFTLVFDPLPTPTLTPTPVPPTSTPVPPTATPVPPTATLVPPSPTATTVPTATATSSAPTAGPIATATEPADEGGGGCSGGSNGTLSSNAGSLLLLVAPLGVIALLRRRGR